MTDEPVDYQVKFSTSSIQSSNSDCSPEITIDFVDETIDPVIFEDYKITGSTSVTTSTGIEQRQILPAGVDNVVMKPSCSDAWQGSIAISTSFGDFQCTYNGYDQYWVDGNNDSGWGLDYGKHSGEELILDCDFTDSN